jgi:Family of unknown function (DUF6081)
MYQQHPHHSARHRVAALAVVGAAALALTAPNAQGAATPPTRTVNYDSATAAEYHQKWANPYGPLDGAQPVVSKGAVHISAVPFKPGTDFSVFDHLKYIAISTRAFPAPKQGTVEFSVNIKAATPGAAAGHVVHGVYGPPGSYGDSSLTPYSQAVLEGQQAGVVLNMVDFCTGQLFDWFVSANYAFALIERLPTSVTGNTSNPNCPDATEVGLDKAYTQIIRNAPVAAGRGHAVSIAYSQNGSASSVKYTLDGKVFATVSNVGVPLEQQGVPYTGIYAALGPGEALGGKISSFSIGHGLFSLLDAFPFQYGCAPPASPGGQGVCDPATLPYSVSISPSERSFGQGATGRWEGFRVTTTGS